MQELRKAIPMTSPRQATLHTVMGRDRAQGGKGEESEEALGSEDCEGHWNMKMASRQEVEMVRTTKIVRTRWNSQQVKMTKVKMLWRKKRRVGVRGINSVKRAGRIWLEAKPPFPCRAQAIPDVSTWKGTV